MMKKPVRIINPANIDINMSSGNVIRMCKIPTARIDTVPTIMVLEDFVFNIIRSYLFLTFFEQFKLYHLHLNNQLKVFNML